MLSTPCHITTARNNYADVSGTMGSRLGGKRMHGFARKEVTSTHIHALKRRKIADAPEPEQEGTVVYPRGTISGSVSA